MREDSSLFYYLIRSDTQIPYSTTLSNFKKEFNVLPTKFNDQDKSLLAFPSYFLVAAFESNYWFDEQLLYMLQTNESLKLSAQLNT